MESEPFSSRVPELSLTEPSSRDSGAAVKALQDWFSGPSWIRFPSAIYRRREERSAALLILASWFEMVRGSLGEITEVALVAGFVVLSTVLRSRTLLATGTLGLLAYIGYFSGRHFADSVGWPLLLILLGAVMMALGTAAVRINRRYIKTAA